MHHNYSPERLENKAVEILQKYKQGVLLKSPQAMDVDHFAEFYLNTKIDFANLSQDKQTLGCTCFNDGILMVWDDDRSKEIPLEVENGCIFVDNDVLNSEIEGRVRFTIIHECAHWILHKRFYYQKPGETIPKIKCTVFQIENGTGQLPKTDEEIREWQANRLGAALIMPEATVKILLANLLGIPSGIPALVDCPYALIEKMATVYNVSKSAMRIRLKNLSLIRP